MSTLFVIVEAMILASSCSIDAFMASFAYGSSRIKIPPLSNIVVNVLCSAILGVSLWAGSIVRQYLPAWLTLSICFSILCLLGLSKLLGSITKSIIHRHQRHSQETLRKEFAFSLFNFNVILHLWANPEDADVDENKILSPAEAVALAVSLSLDGIAVGFGAALGNVNVPAVVLTSLATGIASVTLGCHLGNTLARKFPMNLSWLSGTVLIAMAFLKLF
ncbi:MAG: manganese efflux pump [Firmicutes bacterium]|nr:manganese efflux pump [Bacillota bacterium]